MCSCGGARNPTRKKGKGNGRLVTIRTGCGFPQELEELYDQALWRPCRGHLPEQLVRRSAEKSVETLGKEDLPDSGAGEVLAQAGKGQCLLEDLMRELVHGHPPGPGA